MPAALLSGLVLATVACDHRSVGTQTADSGANTDAGGNTVIDAAGDAVTDAAGEAGSTLAAACALPFDPGPCKAAVSVFAFVGGVCVPETYGGCQGNDNRFSTIEECMAVCEGRPGLGACPPGRIAQTICLACGLAGGCANLLDVCAMTCDPAGAACPSTVPVCFSGVCQYAGCD